MITKATHFIFILLLFTAHGIYSQSFHTDMQAVQNENMLKVSLSLKGYDHNLIVQTLREGLRSEITYYLRIFRKSAGFETVFGDRLLNEYQYTFNAEKTIFQDGFAISSSEQKRIFSTTYDFMKAFFTYDKFEIPNSILSPEGDHYLQGRIRIKKIKLVPPFNLINLFWTDNNKVTSWTKLRIPAPD